MEEVFPPESAGTLYVIDNGVEREATQEEWEQVFGPSPTEPSEEARACAQARLDASLRAEGFLPADPAGNTTPGADPGDTGSGNTTPGADPGSCGRSAKG